MPANFCAVSNEEAGGYAGGVDVQTSSSVSLRASTNLPKFPTHTRPYAQMPTRVFTGLFGARLDLPALPA